jgi:tetratricopeptide (TPR) repeat protein
MVFLIALTAIETIVGYFFGGLFASRLESERKKELTVSIESFFEERWKTHYGKITGYAWWESAWNDVKNDKLDEVFFDFNTDVSFNKEFDFFAIYLNKSEPFVAKYSEIGNKKFKLNVKQISFLYDLQSNKQGEKNIIYSVNDRNYLLSVSCLADTKGDPMIPGVMIIAYELEKLMHTIEIFLPLKLSLQKGEKPKGVYHFISLQKSQLQNDPPIYIIIQPNSSLINLIRMTLFSFIIVQIFFCIILFAWIAPRFTEEETKALELLVAERTFELNETLENVKSLKHQQDADYFLTSLIGNPLALNKNKSEYVKVEFYIEQKKKFLFNEKEGQLGGDTCVVGNLRFGNGRDRYIVFVNADAMGKSMQGAGGSIVIGTAINNILSRSTAHNRILDNTPDEWLTETYQELNKIFLTFDGLMLVSAVIGIINERTGEMNYFNAEHPWTCLYRDSKASFIDEKFTTRKIGLDIDKSFEIKNFQLNVGDIIFVGSDGRDDIDLNNGNDPKNINEDENLFLNSVNDSLGDLNKLVELIKSKGELTDDLSILKIDFQIEKAFSEEQKFKYDESAKFFNQAKIFMEKENYSDALAQLENALELDSEYQEALELMAIINYKIGEYKNAIYYADSIVSVTKDRERFLLILSASYKQLKQYEKSIEYGEFLHIINPVLLNNNLNLADTFRILNNIPKGKYYLDKVISIYPNNPKAIKLASLLKENEEA